MLGSLVHRRAVRELQKFVPGLEVGDVSRGPAGVRAQAMSTQGDLVADFIFHRGEGEVSFALASQVSRLRSMAQPSTEVRGRAGSTLSNLYFVTAMGFFD